MNSQDLNDRIIDLRNDLFKAGKRIVELEAENAKWIKVDNLSKELLSNQATKIDALRMEIIDLRTHNRLLSSSTREQIAALVKPLEWENNTAFALGLSYDIERPYGVEGFYAHLREGNWSSDVFEIKSEARAAAEQHHRETVLNLLNLPA